ncbi:hypothetical protein KJ758_02600 [Patescibacteria group bacterium]|nr:hypothetical protein [Patescibacteria group bacterium]
MDRPKNYEHQIEEGQRPKFDIDEIKLIFNYNWDADGRQHMIGNIENENWRIFQRLMTEIKKDFPDLYHNPPTKEELENIVTKLQALYADEPENLKILNESNSSETSQQIKYHLGIKREDKIYQLYYLVSCLKKGKIDEEDPINDIKTVLDSKKLLVLGDDNGSLSEMLRFYGADAYGIEYDELAVLIAHSGILSRDGKPQTQLLSGNIGDLSLEQSELIEKLQKLGPFDTIMSHAVFNTGSGIEDAIHFIDDPQEMIDMLWKNINDLLDEDGIQLHTNVDMPEAFSFKYDETIKRNHAVMIPKEKN